MALHVSGKLVALGLVITALITAFSAPRQELVEPVPLALSPTATVLDTAVQSERLFSVKVGPAANPRYTLRATGYNSAVNQTDSTPRHLDRRPHQGRRRGRKPRSARRRVPLRL